MGGWVQKYWINVTIFYVTIYGEMVGSNPNMPNVTLFTLFFIEVFPKSHFSLQSKP